MTNKITIGGQQLTVSDFKRLKTIRGNELARATASKLVEDSKATGVSGYDGTYRPSDDVINRLSTQTATNIEDFSNIFQTLPDTKIAMEIWTSCIVTPKDGLTESLSWSIDNENSEYSSQLFGRMLDHLRDFFEKDYNIFKHLKPAVEDALFKTGSYVLALAPESSVDDIINGKSGISNESVINAFFNQDERNRYHLSTSGYLGPLNKEIKNPKMITTGLESLIHNPVMDSQYHSPPCLHTSITDNVDILKFPKALARSKRTNLSKMIRSRYSLESHASMDLVKEGGKLTSTDPRNNPNADKNRFDTDIKNSPVKDLYRQRDYENQPVVRLKGARDASRLPIGHPLELKLPSSSVIPVHVPGNPRDIVGAFVILDEYGNPLDSSTYSDLFNEQREKSEQTINAAGSVIKSMSLFNERTCNLGRKDGSNDETLNELAKTYASLFEEDLLQRFNNGIYGRNIEIARADEAWRIMFARACAAMRTQLLYIPSELLTYFAFDYNRYGLGKSLLEDGKSLATMRAAMLYSQIYSNILNNIGRRKISVSVDEDAPDPAKVMAIARSEYNRANAWGMPLLSQGPIDSINTLRESNIDVVLEGEHPALPTTRIDVEDVQTQRISPDDDISDKIKNLHIASFGLPVSSVDETQQAEFATVALQNNTLFNKRTVGYQNIFNNDFLYNHITKFTLSSGRLIKELSFIIKENKDLLTDEQRQYSNTFPIIEAFLERLSVTLPSPDGRKLDDQKQDFDKYSDFIDSLIEKRFPNEILSTALPEPLKEKTMAIREAMKMIMISRYIDDHNYLPGLSSILDLDNVDDTVQAEVFNVLEPVAAFAAELFLSTDKISKKTNDPSLKGVADDGGSDNYGGGYGSDTDEDDNTDSGDGDFDFGSDLDDGSDDADDTAEDSDTAEQDEPTEDVGNQEQDVGI